MFGIKLKIQKWLSNIKLRKNKERTANQVRDTSFFKAFITLFAKILLLSFFGLIILLPFFFMIFVAMMPDIQSDALKQNFSFFPKSWHPENFAEAIRSSKSSYWVALGLTLANVLFSIVLKIFITMFAGYAFSLKNWRGKNIVWALFISLLILPEVALLSGQYYLVVRFNEWMPGIKDNFFGMVFLVAIPFVASIFNALMFRNAFEAIPGRIKEVAMVDGAVGWRYLFKIAIPMVVPTILTVVILTALASWNSYLWPSLISGGEVKYKIMSVWLFEVGRKIIGTEERVQSNIKMAGSIIAILPMFIFYFIFRKKIMGSISRQGSTIKG
ncbi:putative ABC transporter permease protein MG189 homolog [Metamycoplasma salivarium]|nr:carbohydrate ABC transporter permease [Metamycoplasma salivarium]GIZ05839.1 putative ABC transporter permease protein MG189 homolog [Metamycoplasma salivarium]GIZ06400.1 putative ABC transporter permease protein MG189 homolog [Metamycoplasma salivarium]GIZ07035.1 putative ABC transporter permease protein MG189 homolog [Metamycoplasma salivarium]